MSYEAEISRRNPTCFLFLIDQSGSMSDHIQGNPEAPKKSEFIADAINRVIQTLIVTANQDEGLLRYYQIGVIGYGSEVTKPLADLFPGQDMVWIDDLAANPLRIEIRDKKESDGVGGIVKTENKFPIWIEPVANGLTSMCEALNQTKPILEDWVEKNPHSYPPTIINFTDGMPTDGDPLQITEEIKSLRTADGEVLLFTLHVSSSQYAKTYRCPSEADELPDAFAKSMFTISSFLTPHQVSVAPVNWQLEDGAKAFVYNAGIEELVDLLDIGTRPNENQEDLRGI